MRAKGLLWIVTVAILAFPRTSHAGLMDVIWEMSGPQLLGVGLQCDFRLQRGTNPECTFLGIRLGPRPSESPRLWVNLLAAAYFSTGTDGEENGVQIPFSAGRARMIGIDPMAAVALYRGPTHRWHSAIGLSWNTFFGPDIDTFNNVAIKLRPVAWDRTFGNRITFGLAYNLRLYPDGFDATPTGGLNSTSDPEVVHGFLVGLSF